MPSTNPLFAVAWLIFAIGAGIIVIAAFVRGNRVKSPTKHVADALMGAVLCLLSLIFILGDIGRTGQRALFAAAVVALLASWYLGRHSRKVDRAARAGKVK